MNKRFAVLGSPISHSLSPLMHQAAFAALGIDATYEAIEVNSIGLAETLEKCRKRMGGFNVTAPHKETTVKLVDTLDEDASLLRAVNTVRCIDGRLDGYNTDVEGFANALREASVELRDKHIVVLGTGGAARAVVCAAVRHGAAQVTVAGRRHARAIAICEALCLSAATNLVASTFRDAQFQRAMKTADILVQATSVPPRGLEAQALLDTLAMPHTREHLLAMDLAYGTSVSLFCEEASTHQRRSMDGRAMLVHQGALAFERFTGVKAPIEVMHKAVDEALKLP
ncbi:MAG: shikimate dehydrogenase [Sandaracinaceae bacterium]|nr:shikimate dehydrogenase [Sandaracinaceae bacterium]